MKHCNEPLLSLHSFWLAIVCRKLFSFFLKIQKLLWAPKDISHYSIDMHKILNSCQLSRSRVASRGCESALRALRLCVWPRKLTNSKYNKLLLVVVSIKQNSVWCACAGAGAARWTVDMTRLTNTGVYYLITVKRVQEAKAEITTTATLKSVLVLK